MGIKVSTKTKNKESLKLLNHICSFKFEQECGELRGLTPNQMNAFNEVINVLKTLVNNK